MLTLVRVCLVGVLLLAPVAVSAQQNQQIIQVSNHQRCTTICATVNGNQGAGVPKAVVREPERKNNSGWWWLLFIIFF